jgi:rhodanese-related sulfurtransferase
MEPRITHQRRAEVQILDVRQPEEWATGHIADSVHIPMDEIPSRLHEIARDRPVVAVCRSGPRSDHVAQYLQRVGITAENKSGGLQQWTDDGLPLKGQQPGDR